MRWTFLHGVSSGWSWEQLKKAAVIAESRVSFESRKEAEADAAQYGYIPAGSVKHEAGTVSQAGASAPKAHVLVVQPDLVLCRETARLLSGMHVTATTSWEHALEQARCAGFSCYVVDCSVKDGVLSRFCAGLRDSILTRQSSRMSMNRGRKAVRKS